jgi:DNA-binding SARP family transcriptional activator/WD40 repeat protein
MQVRVLGQIEAIDGSGSPVSIGGPTQRRVLAALALRRNEVVSVPYLVDVVWRDDDVPKRAEHNIRTYVHRLRSALDGDEDRLETVGAGYRLQLSDDELDAARFEQLAGTADRLADTGDAIAALDAIGDAERLWHGTPIEEFAHEDWALPDVARLDELHASLRTRHAQTLLDAGRPADAVGVLERLVAAEPLREQPRALLMRALYESGRHAEALRAFQDFRRAMVDEIGVEPSTDLVELDRAIASGNLPTGGQAVRSVGGYELHERIGEGAFAVVHRATQASLGREVAVKIIRAELANRPEFIRRFEAEAQMVARIEHPHVVPLYDYWREPDRAYLVMRWMTGGSLEARLDDGTWSVDATVELVDQIADALDAAHRQGVVHRDVKPENILFDEAGRAYLGDFGIALGADERSTPEAALSEGSPIYAAPEQLRREPAGPEADVHALAIVAYTALTGRPPFADPTDEPTRLRRQLHDPIPPARDRRPELPAAVDEVLGVATAKAPADRYPTASGFAAAFRGACAAERGSPDRPVAVRPRANPYKGLRAFDETDAADFHGRERLIDELVGHLGEPDTRMLAVVGPSGSGKSSVVRAGLVPALRSGAVAGSSEWFTTTMVPGTHPFEALETALLRVAVNPPAALLEQLRDGERGILRAVKRLIPDEHGVVAILIDQFEELFTGGVDDAERDLFLRSIAVAVTEAQSPVRILLTMRADFYDRPLRHPAFAQLLKQHTVVVTPLAPDELEHTITAPAAAVGVGFEPGLVAEIIADVNHEPGALPLLQYALTQAFDATDDDTISIDAYRSIGGLTGALGRRAEEVFASASHDEQRTTRRLFGRLVALGEGTEDTRRRIRRSELEHDPSLQAAIERFGSARLLTFDRDPASRAPTVEIAHEALIREWPRLRAWLDEDRDDLRIHRHLTETTAAWIASGRDDGELYRGARLDAATTWAGDHDDDLNAAEREFLTASIAAHEAEQAAERERFDEQVRANRRLRALTAVATVIAVVAAAIGVFALQQRSRADEQADEALAQAAAANDARLDAEAAEANALDASVDAARERVRAQDNAFEAEQQAKAARAAEGQADLERLRAVARALAGERPPIAALLAVEAFRADPSNASADALHRVLTAVPGLRESIPVAGLGYARAELIDDTTLVAAGQTLDLWDLPTRTRLASIELPDLDRPPLLSVSTDGRWAALATGTDRVAIVDLDTDEIVSTFSAGAPLTDVTIDPLGAAVAVGRQDGTVGIWSLPEATESLQIDVGGDVRIVRWSPSEAAIATVTNTSTVQFWDATTGAERWNSSTSDEVNVLTALPTGAIFSPEGDLFVVDSGLLNPILRTFATVDGSAAFPPTRRADGETGTDILVWRDSEQRHLSVGSLKSISTYDLANGVEVGERIAQLTLNDAVFDSSRDEFVAVGHAIIIRAADGSGPLETILPLSDEHQAALDAGGSIHPTIADDGSRVMVSAFVDATIPPATAFDLTTTPPDPIAAPFDRRLPFGNGPLTMTFGVDPPGFDLLDADDGVIGSFPLTFDMIDQDVSADGRFAVFSHADGKIDLYSGTGELLHVFDLDLRENIAGAIVIPSLTDDGRFVVASASAATTDRAIAVWSTETFERIDDGRFAGQTRAAGNLVANRSNGVVRLHSLPDLEPVGEAMINEPGGQFYPAFDAEHGRLAVTSRDAVTVYDVETGQQIGDRLPYRPIRIEYTADGNQLVVGSGDRVTVWNFDADTWADIACRVAGRNLTRAEWEQLGPRTIDYRATCDQYPIEPAG